MEESAPRLFQKIGRRIIINKGNGKDKGEEDLNGPVVNGDGVVDEFLRAVDDRMHEGAVPDRPEGRGGHEYPDASLDQDRSEDDQGQHEKFLRRPLDPRQSRP